MNDSATREIEVPQTVIDAVLNQSRINEAPHNFYKYPARFAPNFAREAIKAFTKVGETVLDPFCGGGTSLVEAILLGRRAVGFDISSLAVFLSKTKTCTLSIHDRRELEEWLGFITDLDETSADFPHMESDYETHYLRNLPDGARSFFGTLVYWISLLPGTRQQSFARLALLGTGQWALDCKRTLPAWPELKAHYCNQLKTIIVKHTAYLSEVARALNLPSCRVSSMRRIINRSSEGSKDVGRVPKTWLPAKLLLTSPPYPGVHVVYHRWQINGRKETPAPFWLANARDGAGEAHYGLGRRDEANLTTYYTRLGKAFTSVRSMLDESSVVAQLVAFSQPSWQLPAFLTTMQEAGYDELKPICDSTHLFEGRIWRNVPGRKWYAKDTPSSQEVMLLHSPKSIPSETALAHDFHEP